MLFLKLLSCAAAAAAADAAAVTHPNDLARMGIWPELWIMVRGTNRLVPLPQRALLPTSISDIISIIF